MHTVEVEVGVRVELVVERQVVINELAEEGDAGCCALRVRDRLLFQQCLREVGELLVRLLVERREGRRFSGTFPDREHSPEA